MTQQPLTGVRVLDLSRMLTGGYASMLLGDCGAEVIKIEDPDCGDPLRNMPPHFHEGQSAYFLAISRNKKSLTLNLKKEEGLALFYRLVEKSDVVFDNFRPGVLSRLKIDYESLKKINPRIICCSNTAYGQTGPLKDGPAFDLVIQALSGIMSYTGEAGRDPVRMGAPMGDLAGSMFAVYSISAALYAREKTGEGRQIDLSLLDCLFSMHTYVSQYYWLGNQLPEPAGSGHSSVVPYRAYKTADGYITIAIFVDKFWSLLCEAIGKPDLGQDERYASAAGRLSHRDEIDTMLGDVFVLKTGGEWMSRLEKAGVPAAPVLNIEQAAEHPQILAREMVVDGPCASGGTMKMIGNPVKQPDVESEQWSAPPALGQDTVGILNGILNLNEQEIYKLKQQGIA
jgi:crotonobetainyl-CoA:carnitine CoA-transferase CaiB-like acyl-CoA transferase